MSTAKGFQNWEQDGKLLRYLYTHKHMSPFEQCGLTVEVQAPIFVFREWHRHRTQSYNEMSGRYTELPDLVYIPSLARMQKNSTTNKQGSGEPFDQETARYLRSEIEIACGRARLVYKRLLSEGVAKELARLVLPVNQYSRMRASANLRNWLQFLTLRLDPAAQFEIRCYAEAVARIIGERFPRTFELFKEGK